MLFLNSLRSQNPSYLHSTYLVSKQNMEYLREPMGLENKFVGYVYLLDQNCKVSGISEVGQRLRFEVEY